VRPIAGISPEAVTLTAAGAVSRVIATLSLVGGTPPITYTIANAGGLSMNVTGNQLLTTVDPCGTVGVHTPTITATDSRGLAKTEPITVTLT
jgi:hypothetical protein